MESLRRKPLGLYTEKNFSAEQFFSQEFGTPKDIIADYPNPQCGYLNTILLKERIYLGKGNNPFEVNFEQRLMVTSNAAQAAQGRIDITGPYRKKPWPLLVMCDKGPNGLKMWTTILCSIQDGINFQELLSRKDAQQLSGRTMWLVRGNGKRMAGPSDLDIYGNPQLARQMTQALFFAGDFETLSYKPWKQRFMDWINSMSQADREKAIRCFENNILMGQAPGYSASPLHTFLHKSTSDQQAPVATTEEQTDIVVVLPTNHSGGPSANTTDRSSGPCANTTQ